MSEELEYRPFDCDNHYYEGPDAFTRHVPAAMQPRVVSGWRWTDGDTTWSAASSAGPW